MKAADFVAFLAEGKTRNRGRIEKRTGEPNNFYPLPDLNLSEDFLHASSQRGF
jgi:hypothetical protein